MDLDSLESTLQKQNIAIKKTSGVAGGDNLRRIRKGAQSSQRGVRSRGGQRTGPGREC